MEKSRPSLANPQQTHKRGAFLAICLISALCLAYSLIAQDWADLKPCGLCLAQRCVYLALLVVGLLGWILKQHELIRKGTLAVLCIGFIIATYHSLLHFKIVSSKCSMQTSEILNSSVDKKTLSHSNSCSAKSIHIFGIPGQVANVVIYLTSFWIVLTFPVTTRNFHCALKFSKKKWNAPMFSFRYLILISYGEKLTSRKCDKMWL